MQSYSQIREFIEENDVEFIRLGDVHQGATLLGFGARAVNPYLAHECIGELIELGILDKDYHTAVEDYNHALLFGVVKIAAKMGISTLQSYQSARIFEAIGLGREVIDRYFTGTVSRVGGIGIKEIEEGVAFRHDHAFDPLGLGVDETLDSVGFHYLRSGRDKEDHMYSPETIIALQRAVRTDSYEKFREYTDLIFTWLRYGKPDVSMTLNASLAGLVAITAGCDCVSPLGAFVIGVAAGFLVVLSVEFFDNIAKIDDPVGAVSVHMVNGIWGTIAVGLFSTGEDGVMNGLFYGGGAKLLGVQALGIIAIDAYVVVTMFVVFKLIDRVIGLRVPAQVEIDGLDMHEHGLASAYSGFSVSDVSNMVMDVNENTDLGEGEYEKATQAQIAAAVKVTRVTETGSVAGGSAFSTAGEPDTGMHKVAIICRLSKFDELKHALNELGVTGMTMTQVMGCGIQKGSEERYRGAVVDSTLLPKVKVEVIVSRIPVERVIESAKKALYTGHIGDGKIFVYNVMKVIKVRTGEEDFDALQDVE